MHLLINYIHVGGGGGGGGAERLCHIVTANQILDGLGTVGTKHADIGPTKAEEPSLNCNSPPTLFSVIVASGSAALSLLSSLVYCNSKSLLLSVLFALNFWERSPQLSSVSSVCFLYSPTSDFSHMNLLPMLLLLVFL